MKTELSKQDIVYAAKLHKRSLTQVKEFAIAAGWMPKFVDEVANLDYSLNYLQGLNRKGECSKKQLNAILAVRDCASLEIASTFA